MSNENRKAKLAVVGLGKMGIMHTAMVRVSPNAELVALVDRDSSLANHVKSMGNDAPTFDSLAALFGSDSKPDGVILATPQFTHRALIEEALAAGVHILTEKPLAHTLDDARAAHEAATQHSDLITCCGFMKGCDPLFRQAAIMLRRTALGVHPDKSAPAVPLLDLAPASPNDSLLGELKSFQASVFLSQVFKKPDGWTFDKNKAGGGVLINTGIHLLFLLRLFFGPLQRVAAICRAVHANTEDTVTALVEHQPFEGQTLPGTVQVNWSTPGYETEGTSVMVTGTGGSLWIEDNILKLWLKDKAVVANNSTLAAGWHAWKRSDLEAPVLAQNPFTMSPEYAGLGYYLEVDHFARAILGEPNPMTFDTALGLEMQAVVDAYYRSAEAGGAWTTPESAATESK
jgi:predicted dehydrogenase